MKRALLTLRTDEQGATAVEYALMATLIAVVISALVMTLGQEVVNMFRPAVNALRP